MTATQADLLARTAGLVDVSSVSHEESVIADLLEAELRAVPWLRVDRVGDNVVARTTIGADRRILLAGHLDTVPPKDNARARVEGDAVSGVGSTDMKGGLAVLMDLASRVPEPAVDVTYAFYACEEVDRRHNGLVLLATERPRLLEADVAVLAEPTAAAVEAGCQGTMRVVIGVLGERAHTARAWRGSNAIHGLAGVLGAVAAYEGRRPVIDGCEYRESLQAVRVEGGVATNVVPDRACVVLNHRFAPDLSAREAEARLRETFAPLLGSGGTLLVEGGAPAARPHLDDPLLRSLVRLSGQEARAKLGWTDVAFFEERGVPAANFGPGDPELAHSPHEFVTRDELERVSSVLEALITGRS